MQKKLIAIAVVGMLTAPLAMAQSNVTIYGLMDLGLNYESSNTASGVKSRTGLDSGLQSGNRIGFRGTEDLGNGLRASFVAEWGHAPDINANGGSFNLNRQSFLALAGDFGTVAVGRQYTPQFGLLARLDPFGAAGAGQVGGIYTWNARVDNAVAYVSPNFNGLTVTVAHSFNAAGTEVAKDAGNAKVWAVSPRYSNGPIDAQLNYHQIKLDTTGAKTEKVWDLGGSYDFGVVKAVAIYGTRKQSLGLNAGPDVPTSEKDSRFWLVGASAPVGEAGTFKLSYVANKNKVADTKARAWNIGYDHKLSARTNVYTAYSKRGQDFAGYKNQFNVGLRHSF